MTDQDEKPTVAIRREVLLGLVAETASERPRAHTVRRDDLATGSYDELEIRENEDETVSPTLVLGMIMLLLVVFIVAVRLS